MHGAMFSFIAFIVYICSLRINLVCVCVCVCIHLVIGSFSDTVCELADETCNVFSAAELANRTACPVSWKSFQGSSRQLRLQVA